MPSEDKGSLAPTSLVFKKCTISSRGTRYSVQADFRHICMWAPCWSDEMCLARSSASRALCPRLACRGQILPRERGLKLLLGGARGNEMFLHENQNTLSPIDNTLEP